MQLERSTPGFADECRKIRDRAGSIATAQVNRLVREDAQALADTFYLQMFADAQAALLLDHAVVNDRLRGAMTRWLLQLFDPGSDADRLAEAQRITGEVHARIGVPPLLVSRAARVLTRGIVDRIAALPADRLDSLRAAQYVYEMFSLAIDAMVAAYSVNNTRLARSDEAFRLHFLGQDMKAERERRRSELMEWAHLILNRYYWSDGQDESGEAEGQAAQAAQFSLWLDHKAAILFDGAPELELIRAEIDRVESQLLPRLGQVRRSHQDARLVVGEIHQHIDRIKSLLGAMFDRYLAVEDGRDSVTALLNRRYFPAIAKREIDIAKRHGSRFAVLMVNIDHFAELMASWGLERTEQVLARVAHLLQEAVRAGDFVFRLTDDDFLVLLVEADETAARRVADGLRRRAAASPIRLGGELSANITLSVGGAVFDDHPDYQRLLDRADAALRQAQAGGPDACAFAD